MRSLGYERWLEEVLPHTWSRMPMQVRRRHRRRERRLRRRYVERFHSGVAITTKHDLRTGEVETRVSR